jgi:hypothetical protein
LGSTILLINIGIITYICLISGGPRGYSDVVWTVKSYRPDSHITFTYHSSDGEEGNIYIFLFLLLFSSS